MNSYGHLAQAAWTRHAPGKVAALEDPEAFFTELGEQIEDQVSQAWMAIPPADVDQLTWRLQRKSQAEDIALDDLVYGPIQNDPSSWPLWEQLDDLLGQLPNADMVKHSLDWLAERDEDEESGSYWVESEEGVQLRALLPILESLGDTEKLSEAQMRQAITQLTPFLSINPA
jgi:hypothetical protein